jgi:RNA polymerase sigma factor (sigma-70 family)
MTGEEDSQMQPSKSSFATTRWSVVLAAGNRLCPAGRQALETLCRTYWYPLYAYARRSGRSSQDAEDLTQAFLARLIEKNLVQAADRERGRFRSFLLTSFKHFAADERDRTLAKKRGGDARVISLDFESAETRYHLDPADDRTAESAFDHQWAVTVLETVFNRLREQYGTQGKAALFEQIKVALARDGAAVPYSDLAARLEMTEGAVRVAVHRLRGRYRELLREEIGHTVGDTSDVEEEIRHLFEALAR